jgi:hypothetical protein
MLTLVRSWVPQSGIPDHRTYGGRLADFWNIHGTPQSFVRLPEAALLDRWRARPVLLRDGVGQLRAWSLEHKASLSASLPLDPVQLHGCWCARLAGLRIWM